jgi:hypothetical protein
VAEDSDPGAARLVASGDGPIAADVVPLTRSSTAKTAQTSPTSSEGPRQMLDIHPPHEAARSWKDFFIHLGTITIGLLLAIGLEQSVEAWHHRQQVRETRVALQAEHRENIERFHRNVTGHLKALAYLHSNLRVLMYLQAHPGTPEAKLPGTMLWQIFAREPVTAAWSTAEHTNILALMPAEEVRAMTADYFRLDYAWRTYQLLIPLLGHCTAYFTHTSDVSTLSPEELAQVIECTEQAQSLQSIYGDTLSLIAQNKDYGPAPDWWQMVPFHQMAGSLERAKANPEAYSQTMRDVAAALSGDSAGSPKN